ncbi:MAG TPA: IPExxxVDY family protein [Aquaticitalea sp.]|nr:IPExxxVDY family protein [Aquaticitalea sp.]HNU58622.1 IPExxxVDY family protein [Aquaticitalea sp.]
MAKHQLLLDDFYDPSFILIAIHSRLEDYRLAYMLNKYLGVSLSRLRQDLDYNYLDASFAIYQWEDTERQDVWNLIANVCKKEEASLQSSGTLFQQGATNILKTYYLLPEFKKVDYFIKVTSDDASIDGDDLVGELNAIPQIVASYVIEPERIKTKNNLIF